jgi:G3E family GTPase
MSQARYIFLGGFIGAGKTTALAALAREFAGRGRRVALLVNNHGAELVDAALLRADGFPTEEVGGGDLGSRFSPFVAAAKKLEAASTPDVILVEAVGTSLDLAATVMRPLRQLEGLTVAPLSVLVDPVRAEQVLGLAPGKSLPAELLHLYRKQLEEAQIIVIAQADRLDDARLERLREKLAAAFSSAKLVAISTAQNRGLAEWLGLLEAEAVELPSPLEINADACAEVAAVVGCLNAVVEFTLSREVASELLLESIGRHLRQALAGVDVLHLHAALRVDEARIGTIHFIGDGSPAVARSFAENLEFGELMINLRAATHPEQLHTAVRTAIVGMAGEFPGLITEFAHLHYFRPAVLEPNHRLPADPA